MAKKYNCVKNGISYYRITRTIGTKFDGSPAKKEFYGDGKADAEQKANEYINKLKSGLPVDYEKVTIAMLMNKWLFDVLLMANDFKSASFEKHETNYRLYIKDSPIGILPVYNIISLPIQKYYNSLYKDKKISTNKINDINKTLSAFFSYTIDENYRTKNPCSKRVIKIPGESEIDIESLDKDNEVQFLSDEELEILTANLDYDKPLHVAIGLALTSLLREGEILGLDLKHLDLDETKDIKVRQILTRAKIFNKDGTFKRTLRIATPKSKTSIRTVPLVESYIPKLRHHIENQKKLYLKFGKKWDENALLFLNSNLNLWDPKNFRTAWYRFLDSIGLPRYKVHILRHTGCSLLFRAGVSLEEAQEIMGHEDSDITRKIYLHFHPEQKRESINKLSYLTS